MNLYHKTSTRQKWCFSKLWCSKLRRFFHVSSVEYVCLQNWGEGLIFYACNIFQFSHRHSLIVASVFFAFRFVLCFRSWKAVVENKKVLLRCDFLGAFLAHRNRSRGHFLLNAENQKQAEKFLTCLVAFNHPSPRIQSKMLTNTIVSLKEVLCNQSVAVLAKEAKNYLRKARHFRWKSDSGSSGRRNSGADTWSGGGKFSNSSGDDTMSVELCLNAYFCIQTKISWRRNGGDADQLLFRRQRLLSFLKKVAMSLGRCLHNLLNTSLKSAYTSKSVTSLCSQSIRFAVIKPKGMCDSHPRKCGRAINGLFLTIERNIWFVCLCSKI